MQIWKWSATETRARIAAGEVSCTEVVTQHIDRCEAINPSINAVVTRNYEQSLAQARRMDQQRREARPSVARTVPPAAPNGPQNWWNSMPTESRDLVLAGGGLAMLLMGLAAPLIWSGVSDDPLTFATSS